MATANTEAMTLVPKQAAAAPQATRRTWIVVGVVSAVALAAVALGLGLYYGLYRYGCYYCYPIDPPLVSATASVWVQHDTSSNTTTGAAGVSAVSNPTVLGMRVVGIYLGELLEGYNNVVAQASPLWVSPACATASYLDWSCSGANATADVPFLDMLQSTEALNAQLNSSVSTLFGFAGTQYTHALLVLADSYSGTVGNLQWQGGAMAAPVLSAVNGSDSVYYWIAVPLPVTLQLLAGDTYGITLTYTTTGLIGSSYAELDIGADPASSTIVCDTTAAPGNATTCLRTPTFTASIVQP